jgi:hypothetical protein
MVRWLAQASQNLPTERLGADEFPGILNKSSPIGLLFRRWKGAPYTTGEVDPANDLPSAGFLDRGRMVRSKWSEPHSRCRNLQGDAQHLNHPLILHDCKGIIEHP